MRSRPKPSERIRRARKERNHEIFRWTVAGCLGALGALSGMVVAYWIQEMEHPSHRAGRDGPSGWSVWWFDFAVRWKWALASASSGTLGILLPTLSYLKKRKEVATRIFGVGVMFILVDGVALAWGDHLPVWEICLPAFLCSLAVNLIVGMKIPPLPDDPFKRHFKPTSIPPSPKPDSDRLDTWSLSTTYDLEQLVDANMECTRPNWWLHTIRAFQSLIVLLVFLLLHLFLPAFHSQQGLFLAGGALLGVTVVCLRLTGSTRRRFRKILLERFGDSFPQSFECSLDEEGLHHGLQGEDHFCPWTSLSWSDDLSGGLLVVFKGEGAGEIFLPARAFRDAADRRRWKMRIHSILAQTSSQLPPESREKA